MFKKVKHPTFKSFIILFFNLIYTPNIFKQLKTFSLIKNKVQNFSKKTHNFLQTKPHRLKDLNSKPFPIPPTQNIPSFISLTHFMSIYLHQTQTLLFYNYINTKNTTSASRHISYIFQKFYIS